MPLSLFLKTPCHSPPSDWDTSRSRSALYICAVFVCAMKLCESHVHNSKDVVLNYTEVLVYHSFVIQERFYKDSDSQGHCRQEWEAVWYNMKV